MVWQGQADARDAVPAAARVRLRPDVARPRAATIRPAPRRCSTSSATSIATATAGATCRTASRCAAWFVPAGGPGAPVRRAVEEEHECGRHPGRVHQAEMAGPAEGWARRAIADVAPRQHRHDDRRLRLSSACSRASRRGCRTSRVSTARIRPPVRAGAPLPDGPERPSCIREMSALVDRVRAVEVRRLSLREHRRPSVGPRATSTTCSMRTMEVLRHRPRAARRGEVSGRMRGVISTMASCARPWPRRGRAGAGALRAGGGGRHEQDAARRVPAAETGFDPQAISDLYSGYVTRVDLRSALPLRLPGAAVQDRPEHRGRDARDLRRRQDLDDQDPAGHLLRRRPRVQGQEARADRRRLRLFVEAPARPQGARAEHRGHRRPLRRRRRGAGGGEGGGQVRLRRAVRRRARARPLHDPAEAQASRLRPADDLASSSMAAVAREVVEAYGDAEQLGHGESGGHRPVSAEGMAARAEDRAGSEPDLSRGVLPGQQRPRRPGDPRGDEGQEAARHRPHRDQHHRGVEPAAARLPASASSTSRTPCRPISSATCWTPGNRLKPELAAQGITLARGDPADDHVRVLQHGRPGGRRLHEGEDRAAARDQHGVQHRRRDQGRAAGAGAAGDADDRAQPDRPRSDVRRPCEIRSRRRRRRCSTSSATSTATATAGAICRTASRSRCRSPRAYRRSTGSSTSCGRRA